MKKIIVNLFFVVFIIVFINYAYAKYIINKNFNVTIKSTPLYFDLADFTSSTIEQKSNEANLSLSLNNFISDNQYDNFDTKYDLQVSSDKYNITITDMNNGTLIGGAKKTNTINIKFVPKDSTNLTLEEQASIVINVTSPYKKQITKNITIKNSDILYNVGVVSGGYDTNINSKGVVGWQSLTADNFFLDLTKVEIPGLALGTMNFSKEYDATTGTLNLHRTSIQGPGFVIQFTANIFASFQPVFVGNVTGDYTAKIDCTGVTDWKTRTVNDFIIDIKWMDLPDEITGTCYITKSYNASTGILTINRSSLQGNGTVTFNADVYTTRFPSQVTSLNANSNLTVTSNEELQLTNNELTNNELSNVEKVLNNENNLETAF